MYEEPEHRNHNGDFKNAYQTFNFYMMSDTTPPPPLQEALRELPELYLKALRRPLPTLLGMASIQPGWDLIAIQMLLLVVATTLLNLFNNLLYPDRFTISGGAIRPEMELGLKLGSSFGALIYIPLVIFLAMGVLYLLARLFGGDGTFRRQCYLTFLFGIPLGMLVQLIALIPFIGPFLVVILVAYGIFLQILALAIAHHLSLGRAVIVVGIPLFLCLLLSCISFFAISSIIALRRS